jgi:hypothetical protein
MRRQSKCAGAFRDKAGAPRVIGKVIRGANVGRLLYYLYGPGRANEHVNPHLVAGFADPNELEPERRGNGAPDLRRLAMLLNQPLAALVGPGYDKPVWHCSVRAAPGDRLLSDAEWARIAARVMHHMGLAAEGDELGVRWVAVRHAGDHIHLVATLARQDGAKPRIWGDYYQVRQACLEAEQEFGLTATAPADRTAARRATRAEHEHAARRGWKEPARATLRREVQVAAAGAGSEQEFFARLQSAGVLVRLRHSTIHPGQVTGYAVALPAHTTRGGGPVWYGSGKLAPDLTLPKLRARWDTPAGGDPLPGAGLSAPAARAVLRNTVTAAAWQARDEAPFFGRLREAGLLVRLRYSEAVPSQVTGYSVALPGCAGPDGVPLWFGGGRLAGSLSLPRLRARWHHPRRSGAEQPGAPRFTAPERDAIYTHSARQAAHAAEHIRRCALTDPAAASDAAWAAADTLHAAGRALHSRSLRRAADTFDRVARAPHGRIPHRTANGDRLRAAARLISLVGDLTGDSTLAAVTLVANLALLAAAVADLRHAQRHAAQAAAARSAAEHLHATMTRNRSQASAPQHAAAQHPQTGAPRAARSDFAGPLLPGRLAPATQAHPVPRRPRRQHGPSPGQQAGPAP